MSKDIRMPMNMAEGSRHTITAIRNIPMPVERLFSGENF